MIYSDSRKVLRIPKSPAGDGVEQTPSTQRPAFFMASAVVGPMATS